ncbi:hypothetical protein [Tomitella cavernea]|uniref:Uncharacterized protein n=1 Tax=Tomitella cavernea TaxID=1387982 RepID=A0ABP9C5R7_9ACTN|nr:hypothetical protein [Tomitella cavernea]
MQKTASHSAPRLAAVAGPAPARRRRKTAVAVGIASALGAAVYAQVHRDEFEAMARHPDLPSAPQT